MLQWEGQDLLTPSSRGFVYLIINVPEEKLYIGKKKMVSERRVAVAGRVNKKIVRTPSNWKTYYGSCKPLLADLERLGKNNFRRIVLGSWSELHSVNYAEAHLQFALGVLSDGKHNGFKFYNRNIKITTMRYPTDTEYIKRVERILKGL